LVLGHFVACTIQSICSHVLIRGEKNQFCWDKVVLKEIFHFGKWIFFCSIAAYIYSASDRLLLGGLVDAATLGYYAIATLLATAIKNLISSMISNVGFPALSEAYREKPESLKSVFYKLRIPIDITSMLLAGFLFASSTTIVGLLYDKRYESTGWMLQIITFSFLELRYKLSGECYKAMGKPRLVMDLILFDIVILYGLGYFAFQWFGLKGLIWALSCSSIGTIPLSFYYMKKLGIFNWRLELLALPLIPVGYALGLVFVEIVSSFNN
jgi:O-antigen/teichoic acid export membrane protein